MAKTIKELADELGISKQAIRKHIERLPQTLPVTKKGNVIFLSEEACNHIAERVNASNQQKTKRKVTGNEKIVGGNVTGNLDEVTSNVDYKKLISFYEHQVQVKDTQIKEKDEQLKNAQKLLDQQQILTLQANKKIEQLETELEKEDEPDRSKEEKAEELKKTNEKKGFWQKFFSK